MTREVTDLLLQKYSNRTESGLEGGVAGIQMRKNDGLYQGNSQEGSRWIQKEHRRKTTEFHSSVEKGR